MKEKYSYGLNSQQGELSQQEYSLFAEAYHCVASLRGSFKRTNIFKSQFISNIVSVIANYV